MASDAQGGLSPGWAAGIAVGAVFAALLAGKRASPGPDHPRTQRWYKRLEKPDFTPPTTIYPIAWTAIQAALAYGGYRLLRSEPTPDRTKALALWTINQVGIGGWSEVFFGHRAPGWGTIASAGLGASAIGYVATARPTDKVASDLGVPLVAWVAFATVLSEEIWRKNETVTAS
ncbi:TspO/MBR family protein [Glacieibacterium megasporae]|uniref:TspO/MBR family protein n=1 Tax=Glacieibacterium megasporae TaxID=2835787 RepID=UPI001C1E7CBD|nr:TspO/MBR family protein [Polymorphobacter megasporae]UAJ12643.1 tryptophan-rich sensory protein [Polymorphobacter megasporae]